MGSESFIIVVWGGVVLSVFLEYIVKSAWVSAYFRFGIPIFSKRFDLSQDVKLIKIVPILEQRLTEFKSPPTSVSFKMINLDEFLFQHRYFVRGKFTNIRGVLAYDKYHQVVTLKAYPMWYPYVLPLWPLGITIFAREWFFIIPTFIFMGVVVVIQFVIPQIHFTRLSQTLDKLFQEKMVSTSPSIMS